MPDNSFENVYPGFNAKISFHSDNKIDIDITNIEQNISYCFILLQKVKEGTVDLLDKKMNHICSLENAILQDNLFFENIIKTIITTCIYTVANKEQEQEQEQEQENEPSIKPCYINHFNNEMYPTAFTGYTPEQIRTAYNVQPTMSSLIFKPIITVVIAYCYPRLQRDFDTFCKTYKLPPSTLKIATLDPKKMQNSGWAMEECLDVQWAYAMNPMATIQVVEARSSSFNDMFNAVQYASYPPPGSPLVIPDVISMSWGANESSAQINYDKFFSNTNICYLAATGDTNTVNYPATCPNVLAVGGTSLSLDTSNKRVKETTWSSAGCGTSSVYFKPSYQSNIYSSPRRAVPDISGVANSSTGVVVIYNNRSVIVGGTSVSTPITAGILSASCSKRKELKKKSFTTINNTSNNLQKALYLLYNKVSVYNTNFYDVKIGYDGAFVAGQGYDFATGLGVMNGVEITKTLINA
jgi:subtilase family serine protease